MVPLFNISLQLLYVAACLLPTLMGWGETGKIEVWKVMDWDNNSLIFAESFILSTTKVY